MHNEKETKRAFPPGGFLPLRWGRKEGLRMKRMQWVSLLVCLVLLAAALPGSAEILPAEGQGQFGFKAVVLSERVSVRETPDTRGKVLRRLNYGTVFFIQNVVDGWCDCNEGESADFVPDPLHGYVLEDYVLVDPMFYVTEASTVVYATKDAKAKKVAMLTKDTSLPIIQGEDGWLLVSLRGAAGWIRLSRAEWDIYLEALNGGTVDEMIGADG